MKTIQNISIIRRTTLVFLFATLLSSYAWSQYMTISGVQVIGPYSRDLSYYTSHPAQILITLQKLAGGPDVKVRLIGSLKGDNGILIKSNMNGFLSYPEYALTSNSPTQIVNGTDISTLFELLDVDVTGSTVANLQANGLPPGNYQLCVQAYIAENIPLTGMQMGSQASEELCSASFSISAPLAYVAVSGIQLLPPYSSHLSDFINNPSRVLITLIGRTDLLRYKIKLLASLKGDNGVEISTNPNYLDLLPDVNLSSRMPVQVLNASALRSLFEAQGVILKGISYRQLVGGAGLPEGNYQLCITPVMAQTDPASGQTAGTPLADERCSNIYAINNLEPPVIINPITGSDIQANLPQNVLFSWTVPAGAKPGIEYTFKMVEIIDTTRDPNDAMQSATNPPFFERTTMGNVLLYGPGEPTLTPGRKYAYLVTAADPQTQVTFRNGGNSEVGYFTYEPGILAKQSDTTQTDTTQKNPISLMKAPQLNCSCGKTTISDKTVNNANAKAGSVVHVGAFDMTLNNDVAEKNDSLSGTGTIPVPFLNSNLLKLRVEYSGLQVNASNQAIAGIVRAERSSSAASIMPAYDNPQSPSQFKTQDILNISDYINNNASTAIADLNNSVNSVGWEMPLGIQKEISGEKITVAITDVVFTPEQAGFNACLAFDVPEGGQNYTLALGAKNICFKDSKSLCGDANLLLVEDFKIDPLNLTFVKSTGNGNSQSGTYAVFDPSGFKQLHIKLQYEFPKDVIVRQSDKGAVKATIETDIKTWNNWYASVNIDSFNITGYDEWGFKLKGPAFYDHSDSMNAPGMPTAAIEGKTNFLDKDWMGFFMPNLEATLPAVIKRADNKPVSLAIKNFMIDNQGITGDVNAENVLAINDGSLNGWYYSLDTVSVRFVNTSFIKGGLNGKLLLPVSGSPNNSSQDELDYTCTLSKPPSADSSMKFQFVIQPKNDIHASLWAATLTLDKTSNITVSNKNNTFNASATLNGDISIEADLSPIPKIDFKAVQFQDLELMTQSPYIGGNVTFGFASPDKSAGGFPVSISDVKPEIKGSSAGISFGLNISLTDISSLPKGTFNLAVMGDLSFANGRPNWGNPHLQVNQIKVKGPLGPLDVDGQIDFFDKDATYGNGIRGGLDVKLALGVTKIDINSHVMFGHTTFSYWYVDVNYLQSTGIVIVSPVSLFGLGGGVCYNMSKTSDVSPDALLKGTSNDLNRYKPEDNTIGFKASVVVGVGNGTPFHAKGTFSMEFTSQLGVKSVDFDVDAAMLSEITGDDSKAPVTGHGHIGYDFDNEIFDAGVGLNVDFTVLKGSGWLALNVNGKTGDWYFKLGEPENRVNVNVLDLATLNAYFMMGNKIPGIPDPPANILQYFPSYKASRDNSIVSNGLAPGFAFGAGLNFGPIDLSYLIFYMHFSAGMGFDVNLRQYAEGCDGSNTPPGINGWYANGQFYAWVDFSFGIQVDVWFYSGKIDVADLQAAALLQAGLVNPSWFEGWLYGHYDVLGGMISGDMHFHASYGNKCVPTGNPLGSDMPIISQLSPDNGDKDVSIARNPVVAFNFPVDYDFEVKSNNSNGDEVLNTVHIDVTDFSIRRKSDNMLIADLSSNQNFSLTQEMKLGTLYTKDALDPQTDYTVNVSVQAFDQNHNPLYYKGNLVEESKSIAFKTGDCLHRLDENAQTLLGSYPFKNQRYFLQKEQTTGYIQLDKNYPCLLNDPNYDLLAEFISFQSPSQTTTQDVPVGISGDQLTFQVPSLPNDQIAELRIIKRRKVDKFHLAPSAALGYESKNKYLSYAGGNSSMISIRSTSISGLSESNAQKDLELYSYYFKTSKYNTLADKLNHSDVSAIAQEDGFGNLEGYTVNYNFDEGFDVFDVNETTFEAFGNKYVIYPLVHVSEQAPGNAWIQNYVNGYLYSNWKTAYLMGADYKQDINPAYLRKSATGLQCLIFEPSLNPVGILPMSTDPPLSSSEINAATNKFYNISMTRNIKL